MQFLCSWNDLLHTFLQSLNATYTQPTLGCPSSGFTLICYLLVTLKFFFTLRHWTSVVLTNIPSSNVLYCDTVHCVLYWMLQGLYSLARQPVSMILREESRLQPGPALQRKASELDGIYSTVCIQILKKTDGHIPLD